MEGFKCPDCGYGIHKFNTAAGDCFYCANCDRDYLESEVEWGTIPVIGVDRLIDKDTSLIIGVNNKFYIGVIQSEDGTYHIDLHTPLGVFEEFDYCPEEDENEDNN